AVTMAIYGVIVLAWVPETRPAVVERAANAPPNRSWIADREFVVFVAITFGLALLPFQSTAPLSAHMTWQGLSPAAFGGVMAVNGLLIIALQPAISTWSMRREPTGVLAAAALFYGVGFAMHGLATNIGFHAAAVTVRS